MTAPISGVQHPQLTSFRTTSGITTAADAFPRRTPDVCVGLHDSNPRPRDYPEWE